jgi:hypothetical protein
MAETFRHDTWQAADRYEAYMGRWSRQIAPRFLDWLDAGSGLDWLVEMKRVARAGATLGFYVWDYPGQGVEFMRAFWDAAAALDSVALDLAEDKRFSFCTRMVWEN